MRALECCVLLITLSTSVAAENWPHWRGPNGDGVSRETGLPTNWSATNGVAWRTPMPGRSGATPIIWGETVFLQCRGRRRSTTLGARPEGRELQVEEDS